MTLPADVKELVELSIGYYHNNIDIKASDEAIDTPVEMKIKDGEAGEEDEKGDSNW